MLRSLVGSEMCIRDSAYAMSNSVLEHIPHVQQVLNEVGRAMAPGGMFYFCLLYTSDAADDLLCVDLGGRRLIKKKKWKKYVNWYHLPHKLLHDRST